MRLQVACPVVRGARRALGWRSGETPTGESAKACVAARQRELLRRLPKPNCSGVGSVATARGGSRRVSQCRRTGQPCSRALRPLVFTLLSHIARLGDSSGARPSNGRFVASKPLDVQPSSVGGILLASCLSERTRHAGVDAQLPGNRQHSHTGAPRRPFWDVLRTGCEVNPEGIEWDLT